MLEQVKGQTHEYHTHKTRCCSRHSCDHRCSSRSICTERGNDLYQVSGTWRTRNDRQYSPCEYYYCLNRDPPLQSGTMVETSQKLLSIIHALSLTECDMIRHIMLHRSSRWPALTRQGSHSY